jgi:hypothetical protein
VETKSSTYLPPEWAAALHVIDKKVLEENPSNSKILMKWQNPLFMERIQIEHVTLFSSYISSQVSDCIEFGGV